MYLCNNIYIKVLIQLIFLIQIPERSKVDGRIHRDRNGKEHPPVCRRGSDRVPKSGIRAGVEKALTLSSQKIKLIIVTNITQMRGITITARNKQMAYLFEKISFSV